MERSYVAGTSRVFRQASTYNITKTKSILQIVIDDYNMNDYQKFRLFFDVFDKLRLEETRLNTEKTEESKNMHIFLRANLTQLYFLALEQIAKDYKRMKDYLDDKFVQYSLYSDTNEDSVEEIVNKFTIGSQDFVNKVSTESLEAESDDEEENY